MHGRFLGYEAVVRCIAGCALGAMLCVGCGDDGNVMDVTDANPGDAGGVGDGSATGSADGGAALNDGEMPTEPAFPPTTSLEENGPFETNGLDGSEEGPDCIVHRPATLGEGGLKHPVIIWGMGTGGFNTYSVMFDLWASNGFVVAAATLDNGQGDGDEMLACLDHVCDKFASDVDCRAGASGHSQGGAGAIMAGRDARVLTTAPLQPYTAEGFGGFAGASIDQQTGPMLLLSGTEDNVASPEVHQQPVFEMTNVPVFWATLMGGNHTATGLDGAAAYKGITLAWFRLQLMGDESYRSMFYAPDCSVCDDDMWEILPAAGL